MQAKIRLGRKQIISLFMLVCMTFSMVPMTTYADIGEMGGSLTGTLPVAGDLLEIQGGVLKDGVLVFDLGDYDEFKASLANGERFPITISRPKGDEANYPVAAKLASYSGSNNMGFQIFEAESGEEVIEHIGFPARVSSKTIYIGAEYDLGDNSRSSGTLSSYIYFYDFDRTAMTSPIIRLETAKAGIEGDTTALPLVEYAKVGPGTASVREGESRILDVNFKKEGSIFDTTRSSCEVTDDLTLHLKKGLETRELKPVEALGSILSELTFVLAPNDPINEEWKVVSITGIKNAADGSVINLIYNDDYSESQIDLSSYTFSYEKEPVFGSVTTDKEIYKGLETIRVYLPVENADAIDFGTEFDDWWRERVSLSYDGGQSFIPQNSLSWNSATKSIEAVFAAPENTSGSNMPVAVEVYTGYGDVNFWKAVYGAFKIIAISTETADFVPIESITVSGIPTSGIEKNTEYLLNVEILPENASFPGYSWESSDLAKARVSGDKLLFYDEGKVTITLKSEEEAYRTAQGLPDNKDILIKKFTFFAGTPRLITSSIQLSKSDAATGVTALFNDNFDAYGGEWVSPGLTYEIRNAAKTLVKSGSATRNDGVTVVSLAFDGSTPKVVSLYEKGEFKPAYTITLTASIEGMTPVSATANIYITPPPVAMECLTETSRALVGVPVSFTFEIKNLLPGYSSWYSINSGASTPLPGTVETDPASGLITLTGKVEFTPEKQEEITITVLASNEGESLQYIVKRFYVVDQSAARMTVEFSDGLDGKVIMPESGEAPDLLYGIRESKIIELINAYTYDSQAAFEYLNRMMRTKTLKVVAPREWGAMKVSGAANPVTGNKDISLYLSEADKGREITLSWEDVNTQKKFTFNEDNLSGKIFAFQLLNVQDGKPVSLNYTNGDDQAVEKNITPYKGYVIIYEPTGIKGQVWMSQAEGGYRFASFTQPKSIIKASWANRYEQSPLVVSSLETGHSYRSNQAETAFTVNTVTMSDNPIAKFNKVADIMPRDVRYCAIDKDGKIIAGTNGQVSPASSRGNFEVPFKALYENPNSKLMVEFEYPVTVGSITQIEYYELQTLEGNLKNGQMNNYIRTVSSSLQRLTVTGLDGQTKNLPIGSTTKFLPEDTIEAYFATGTRAIKSASLDIVNYRPINDSSGEGVYWLPDHNTVYPAASIVETDWAGFTPNKYTKLRFKATKAQMTPGILMQINLSIVFKDGSTDKYYMGHGYMADGGTAENVKKITAMLQGQDFFHEKQMEFKLGDLNVEKNTRGAKYEGALFSFNQEVAKEIDKIKINLASPSKNPFVFEVKPKGDEYIIRGYVNADIMNKAGLVYLADSWQNSSFDDLFAATKKYVLQADSKYNPNFPGIKGYIEGKAVIDPKGDIRISFHEGRTYVESEFSYKPKELFDMSYYCSWTVVFEGMVTSIFDIKAPDKGGNPAAPFNFNLEENSWVFMEPRTGHNGISVDIGIYAVKVSLKGKIQDANYRRKSIHRPYAADAQKFQWQARFTTGGDLYETNHNRIITSPSDVDIDSGSQKKWFSWFSKQGKSFYVFHNIEAASSGWGTYKVSSMGMPPDFRARDAYSKGVLVASRDIFNLFARATSPNKLEADAWSAVSYYKGGTDIIYMDSNNNIVVGSNGTPVAEYAFGLDSAASQSGNTLAAWGTYKDDLDAEDLDTLDRGEMLKYGAGKTEIKAGIFNGMNWDIKKLTDNEILDISPKVATNGSEGLVVWTQGLLKEDELPKVELSGSRLMFAQYKGSAWGDPAVLYTPSGESIADYLLAMAADGSALATVLMDSGKIVIIKILNDGKVTVISNSLPATTKASLIYNGDSYTLACYDDESMALNLYELSGDGFLMDTAFIDLPTGIGEDFRLFRDWSATGTKASVLVWPGYSEAGNSVTKIYASKILKAEGDNTMLITAPITAATIKSPSAIGDDDDQAGLFVASYDAYIVGKDIKVLTVFEESKSEESEPSVYLDEAEAQFENTIETDLVMNDISELMPGLSANFNIKVKNKGFLPITSIKVKIGSGEEVENIVPLLPNGERTVTAAFTPSRTLPDSIDYTVTAKFSDGSEAEARDSINLSQADIAAELLIFSREKDDYKIKALISNKTPFSLTGKSVTVGIYEDSFGTLPVSEAKIEGSEFENEAWGTAVLADFSLANKQGLPSSLYLIAKAYDSSDKEIPDKDSMDNILIISNNLFVSPSSSGDQDGGSSSDGGSDPDTKTTTAGSRENTPDQAHRVVTPVTAIAGADGMASLTVADKTITDAIAKAQADARAQKLPEDDIALALDVTMPEGTNSLTTTLTESSLNNMVSTGIASLEINGGPLALALDLAALQEIQRQSGGDISISMAPATELSDEAKALLGNRPVYKITISYLKDGKTINVSSLGKGSARLAIPYTPGQNEALGYLFGVYVDARGIAQAIPNSAYDPNSGEMLIPTDHLSLYGVGYRAPSAKFTDISNHWGRQAIDYVVGRGLLSGTSETTFAPDTAMTRGMLVTALGRLAEVDAKTYTSNSFTDVKADSVFRPYIEWAYKEGVVHGIGNQEFAPDRAITREEIAVVFTNYAKASGYRLPVTREISTYVDDLKIGEVYKRAVTAMQQAGTMLGDTDKRFNPQSNASRAEVTSMLERYIKLTIDPATAWGWSLNDRGQWLYYKDGKALSQRQTIDGLEYFFDEKGVLKTGWVKDGDNWRYYSGKKMLVDWWDLGSDRSAKTYYFTKDGLMAAGKWQQIDGEWYYFYADGHLARNVIIDGYEVDSDGIRKDK